MTFNCPLMALKILEFSVDFFQFLNDALSVFISLRQLSFAGFFNITKEIFQQFFSLFRTYLNQDILISSREIQVKIFFRVGQGIHQRTGTEFSGIQAITGNDDILLSGSEIVRIWIITFAVYL